MGKKRNAYEVLRGKSEGECEPGGLDIDGILLTYILKKVSEKFWAEFIWYYCFFFFFDFVLCAVF
jgi:hypothetical protein